MAWHIIPQEESVGRVKMVVDCKRLKFFPVKDKKTQAISFGILKPVCHQIIMKSDADHVVRLVMTIHKGRTTFTIKHPDRMEIPKIWIGQGKTRRKIDDMLARNKVKVNGNRERFEEQKEFEDRIKAFGGEELVEKVMGLFRSRLVELARAA